MEFTELVDLVAEQGLKGATKINLEPATEPNVLQALTAAWRNTAPKPLLDGYET